MAKIRSVWLEQHQQQQQASSSRQHHDHHLFADQPLRSPLPDQIIEPEPLAVVVSDDQKTLKRRSDDGDLELNLRPIKILRLFGVNIPIYHFHIDDDDDDDGDAASAQTQAMINFHKRLGKNPIHDDHHKRRKPTDDDDLPESSHRLPKKPKILVDIPKNISTTSDNKYYSENPNHHQQEHEHEDEEEHEEEVPAGAGVLQFDPRRLMVEGVEQVPVMLFMKRLTYSDVVGQHNRLLITETQKLLAALTEQEKIKALDIKEDYLRVVATAFNGNGRDKEDDKEYFILHLTKWNGSGAIVLKHQWMKLVRANNLQQEDSVQAWGYRLRGQFRLAFNIIKN